MQKLTPEEYKKLLMDVAISIAPVMIKLNGKTSDVAGANVALYARDIAEAVEAILIDNSGNCFK